jgi:hypothetical protein
MLVIMMMIIVIMVVIKVTVVIIVIVVLVLYKLLPTYTYTHIVQVSFPTYPWKDVLVHDALMYCAGVRFESLKRHGEVKGGRHHITR